MKKNQYLTGLLRPLLALVICIAAGRLLADTTNQPASDNNVGDIVQQAQDALSQASSQQDYQHAADLFEKACVAEPTNYPIRVTLGWVYLDKLHIPGAAYPHLKTAVKHLPDDVNARKLLGMACTQTGRAGEAVTQFRAAAKLQPDDLWIKAQLGRALARYGEWGAANQIFDEVLKADPQNADARLGQAELAAWGGQSEKALGILRQLLQENPGNVEAMLLMADIHRWKWKLTQADQDYQKVLSVDTNNLAALKGIQQTHEMAASEVSGNYYIFHDTTDYLRETVGADARVYLADPLYLTGGVSGWRFTQRGIGGVDRLDARAGLEYHATRWLELSGTGDYFDYEHNFETDHQQSFFGGEVSAKVTPFTGLDIITIFSGNQPYVASMSTVTNALKQHSIGNGIDYKFWGPLSFQNSFEAAKLSDNNFWIEEKPQLSWELFKIPDTFLRVEYDYINYSRTNEFYWTPQNWHIIWPILDTSIPICKGLRIDADGQLPYVVRENSFGYVVNVGPVIDITHHLEIKASYYRSRVPGSQEQWSGQGGQASLTLKF